MAVKGALVFRKRSVFSSFSFNRYARADVLPIGKFSLNLSNCPKSPYGSLVHHLLANIVTQVRWRLIFVFIHLLLFGIC